MQVVMDERAGACHLCKKGFIKYFLSTDSVLEARDPAIREKVRPLPPGAPVEYGDL
jgi:hypothetical protein